MKLTFGDKLQFSKIALQKNGGPLLIVMVFIVLGAVVVYLGIRYQVTFMVVFGSLFAGIPVLGMLFTMPSSLLYYYEQAQTKKYGANTTATIIAKEAKDVSYVTGKGKNKSKAEEFQYFLTYSFEHHGKWYENTFLVASKNCFDVLTIDSSIPIQFLRTNPKQSSVRRRKLSNEIKLPFKDCQ
ncbi:hypothetical protein [uncultured Croceitalea sp.]|uniref:hypothetical protein n=1 Tax=uncultured Croceitalea sp. TaxID=1798908 RepID=UPI003305BE0F